MQPIVIDKTIIKKIIVVLAMAILLIVGIYLLKTSIDASTGVKITNYSQFLPKKYRKEIQSRIETVLKSSSFSDVKMGTISDKITTNLTNNLVTTTKFTLDVESIQTSFYLIVSYSGSKTTDEILISCPRESETPYENNKERCEKIFSSLNELTTPQAEPPIYNALPIYIEERKPQSPPSSYIIRGSVNTTDSLIITIDDYSGDNEKKSLEKLEELGYKPADYTINYYNGATNSN